MSTKHLKAEEARQQMQHAAAPSATKAKQLTAEMVLPILQGLLASGHYTREGRKLEGNPPHVICAHYDSGGEKPVAVQDAIQIAANLLAEVEARNAV